MSRQLSDLDSTLMKIAVPAAVAGIGILAPGALDALIGAINSIFRLGLDLVVPAWVGWTLLAIGILLAVFVYCSANGWLPSRQQNYFALTHTSFPTPAPMLGREVADSGRDTVAQRVCDLSPFFGQNLDVVGALRQQALMINDVRAAQRSGQVVCYGGLVHIPLQIHLGSAISTGAKIRFFEKNRNSNNWTELLLRSSPLGVSTEWKISDSPTSAVIRISISYLIDEWAIRSFVDDESIQVHMKVPNPYIDCVISYSQLDEISAELRRSLDRLQSLLPKDAEVHLMFAGPSSLGVSIGRQISHSIHNKVWVYNYSRQSDPPYAWAVLVNSDGFEIRHL